MGTINEKVDSWTEKAKREFHNDSRWDKNARRESGDSGNQQERVGGTDSSQQDFIRCGGAVTGGILRQLIDEYTNQVAHRNEQKKQLEAEIVQLASRIQEFNSLLEELETNKQT